MLIILQVYSRKIIDKFFRAIGKAYYFENKYGIKSFNAPPFDISKNYNNQIVTVHLSDVYICFDALKDKYTHLGMPLSDSPHVEMIRFILQKRDLKECRYIKEEIQGCLDNRHKQIDSAALIARHVKASKKKKEERLPTVYRLGEKYYALDGKHRMARAFVQGQNTMRCIEIPAMVVGKQQYTKDLYLKMKRKNSYTKHLEHFNQMYIS